MQVNDGYQSLTIRSHTRQSVSSLAAITLWNSFFFNAALQQRLRNATGNETNNRNVQANIFSLNRLYTRHRECSGSSFLKTVVSIQRIWNKIVNTILTVLRRTEQKAPSRLLLTQKLINSLLNICFTNSCVEKIFLFFLKPLPR